MVEAKAKEWLGETEMDAMLGPARVPVPVVGKEGGGGRAKAGDG